MRKIWLIFVNSIQRMRLVFAASLAVGVMLCLLLVLFSSIAYGVSSTVSVGYIDQDNSAVSSDFALYATEQLGMQLVTGEADYLNSELVEKHISAVVEIPAGFEQSVLDGTAAVMQVTYMDDYLNKIFLQNYFEMYAGSIDMLAGTAQGDASKLATLLDDARAQAAPVTTVNLDGQQAQRYQLWTAFMVGIGFFVFISGMLVAALATIIYDDKVNNTFKRVQATNVSSLQYVVGVCAAGFIAIIVMVIVYLAYCQVNGFGELIALPAVGLLCALFVLICVGFALAGGLMFRSRNSILWVSIMVSTLGSMLGGAWFPIEYAPDFMQSLAHITPQFWFIDALYQMHAGQPDAWIISATVLLLFATLCFLTAGIRFANNKSNARG